RQHDHLGTQVVDQPDLPGGHSPGGRYHRGTEFLGAVVCAEASGEQPVAVRDVYLVLRSSTRGVDGPCHHCRPYVHIGLGVGDHGRLAGCSAGSVDTGKVLLRNGQHAERVALAQVVLGRGGELGQVIQITAVVGVDACVVELPTVERHI